MKNVDTLPESLLLVTGTILLTLFLSAPLFTDFTNKVAGFRFPAEKAILVPGLRVNRKKYV